MFTVSRTSPKFLKRLRDALITDLKQAGIENAKIKTEPVRTTKLHRVMVVSEQFKHLRPTERQDLIWRIAGQALTPEEQLRISMIVTVTPEELGAA